MRILCLTSRLPYPPDRGDRLRAYHFIRELSKEHDLSLLSFIADDRERQHVEPLRAHCRDVQVVRLPAWRSALAVAAHAWRPEPLQALYYRSPGMRRRVALVLGRTPFDVAYVHLFRMAQYVDTAPGLYRIVDLTDAISEEVARSLPYRGPVSRLIYRLERPRIERCERQVCASREEVWLISQADRDVLASRCPGANLQVVPNGVDTDRFFATGQPCDPNRLIFVGHLRVFHNIDAATHLVQDVLPLVRQQVPECSAQIVGADPGPQVRRLADRPGVTVPGYVPDLNGALNQAAVFCAPLRFCAGVQNKVLEAMAAGRPVVTTPAVNAGLGACAGREILLADDPEAMAGQIVALLRDAGLRQRVGQAGLDFVRRSYRWAHASERMRAIAQYLGLQA